MSPSSAPFLPIEIHPGRPHPLGATVIREGDGSSGVNFSLFSANATAVDLLLFDRYDDAHPRQVVPLDPVRHKTYYYWHAYISGIGDGQIYAYRVQGAYQPEEGLRFNGNKVLLDPYARGVAYGANWSRAEALGFSDNTCSALKSVVVDTGRYDWEGDHPLQRPMNQSIIYEMHVRNLTAHPSAGSSCPGTYAGIIDKIPYLQSLGITAVELLPVQQFDEQEVSRLNPLTRELLKNHWGYASLAYFAPHLGYGCHGDARRTVDEFRDMVKALHRAGIEVILDVVFNHTGEAGERGPTICFRGLENAVYYMLKPDHRFYQDFSGCGNTVSGNHSIVRRLVCECLDYWVQEYHIDGFRFDLASVFSRGEDGEPLGPGESPILWGIDSDPVLAGTKLIAEAWDAAGLYELGSFTGDRWAEWNGRFRDDVRRFVRGDPGAVRDMAWRMTGSFDVFRLKPSYVSHRSINYVTCHDGFTLADLVSYDTKHNEANGEENRDGADYNLSWNCGAEGPTADLQILALRRRQSKNLVALLMVARGTPMVLGGDEMGRTQNGNNNAYCQDNEISWFDWRLLQQNADLWRFTSEMIALRKRHPTLTTDHGLTGKHYEDLLSEGVSFHGVKLEEPDWGYESRALGIELHPADGDHAFYIIANAYAEAHSFELPKPLRWRRLVDTSQDSPHDLLSEDTAPMWESPTYNAAPHSVVILISAP
jgi:isoamylase